MSTSVRVVSEPEMKIPRKYLAFYFEGRDDELDLEDLDVDDLAEKIAESGDDPYEVVNQAVAKFLAPLEQNKERRLFEVDFKDAIAEVKDGNANDAYAAYLKGRGDAAISDVLEDVLEEMDPREEVTAEDEEDEDDGDEDDDDHDFED